MKFLLLFIFLVHFLAKNAICVTIKFEKLSDKENKEVTSVCGRIKQTVNPGNKFPWSVRITAFLDKTFDENGDFAINQCAGILLSNHHILSVAHCFFNYETETRTGLSEYSNKIFTTLSVTAPIVQLGWRENEKLQFVSKRAKVGAWHYSFKSKGRKDISIYYSYYNWALLQLEDDLSKANNTTKWWKSGRIVPLCVADPQTKPDPAELSVFGFGQHEQCPQSRPICIEESNNTVVNCIKPNYYSTCINAASNGKPQKAAGGTALATPGAGWHWKMPKSGISALMAMTLYKDHSSNIIYGTRLKKRTFIEFIKEWLNLESVYDQPISGSIVSSLQTVTEPCSDRSSRGAVCNFGPGTRFSIAVKIGEKGADDRDLYNYLMLLDTGSTRTWVWTQETKFFRIDGDSSDQVSSSEFYSSVIPIPNYTPDPKYKHGDDQTPYGNAVKVDLVYYRNQMIGLPLGFKIDLDMGLITNFNSSGSTYTTQGILGLGLTKTKNPDNDFMKNKKNQESGQLFQLTSKLTTGSGKKLNLQLVHP